MKHDGQDRILTQYSLLTEARGLLKVCHCSFCLLRTCVLVECWLYTSVVGVVAMVTAPPPANKLIGRFINTNASQDCKTAPDHNCLLFVFSSYCLYVQMYMHMYVLMLLTNVFNRETSTQ